MKILSINLWNINEPLNIRMNNLINYLKTISPDIICFQEVSFQGINLQIDNLLHHNNYIYIYAKSDIWNNREEGLAIATKNKIVQYNTYYLPTASAFNDKQRILLYIKVIIGEIELNIYNTHLAYHKRSDLCRIYQINYVLDIINKNHSNRDIILLCGDMNETPDDKNVYLRIINNKKIPFIDSWIENESAYSFSSKNIYVDKSLWPNRRIDYIFSNDKLLLFSKLCMHGNDGFDICSDHYGILAADYMY